MLRRFLLQPSVRGFCKSVVENGAKPIANNKVDGITLDRDRLQEISNLSKGGDFTQALQLLEEAQTETAHRLRGYHLLAFQYQGEQPQAMAEAVSESMQRLGIQADERLCNTLISTLCRHDRIQEAVDVVASLRQDGFVATINTYNPIIHALCRLNDYQKASELLVSVRCEGVEADLITYATLMEHLCEKKQLQEALSVWARMRAKGLQPTVVIGHALLSALGEAKMLDEALQVVHQMLADKVQPGEEQLQGLKGHLLRAERVEDAVRVQQMIGVPETPPIPDDVEEQYQLLLQVAGQYGVNEEQVQSLISAMRNGEIDTEAMERAIKE